MADTETQRTGQSLEDAVFIESNRTMHAHFVKRLAAFTAFDTNLDSVYAGKWLQAINDFEAHPTDETMRYEIQVFTDELNKQRQICFDVIVDLEYYVKKAFRNNASKLREFGFHKTRTERNQYVIKLFLNMVIMRKVADDYTTELTSAGMPLSVLNNIETQMGNLGDGEVAQEYQKRLQIRATQKRIELRNTVYNFYSRVRDAAKVIYRDAPETRKLFEMG